MARGWRTFILLLSFSLFHLAAGVGLRTVTGASRSGKSKSKSKAGTSGSDKPPKPILPGMSNNPSKKYLISSFPKIKQVGYLHLPDTVWRPLTIGEVSDPRGLAVDSAHLRIFVADPAVGKIFWYQVVVQDDGLLMTDGKQHTAVDGYVAKWMACNGVGDLYFTGSQANVTTPGEVYPSVWRMDGAQITLGNALNPTEVYSRSNTGSPDPSVWMPSGVAVDSFMIYWGNEEQGTQNGGVCKGSRQNIGKTSGITTQVLSEQVEEVRGMAVTGETIFFLSPTGLYALPKTQPSAVEDPLAGLIIQPPTADTNDAGWDPHSIAFDGDGTMYFNDVAKGLIYTVPSGGSSLYPLQKFTDAPESFGLQIMSVAGNVAKAQTNEIVSAQTDENSGAPLISKGPGGLVLFVAIGAIVRFVHN